METYTISAKGNVFANKGRTAVAVPTWATHVQFVPNAVTFRDADGTTVVTMNVTEQVAWDEYTLIAPLAEWQEEGVWLDGVSNSFVLDWGQVDK
jgi:hypothetical protein